MRKNIISAVLASILLSACNDDPLNLVINSTQDVETHKSVLQSLPETDKNTLFRYLVRKEVLSKMGQNNLPNGLTVKEVIQAQIKFETERDNKIQEEKQRKEAERVEKEKAITEFNQKFELSVTGARKEKNILNKDILIIELNLKNNSNKSIVAVQPEIQFILGEDSQTIISLQPKKFKNDIPPNGTQSLDFGFDLDDMFSMKAERNIEQLKAIFKKVDVLFSDGTTEKLQ